MATAGTEHRDNDPVTLHRIMQAMIGDGLKEHYQPPQKLSHELFVLLMQLNEREQNGKGRAPRPRSTAKVRAGSAGGASA